MNKTADLIQELTQAAINEGGNGKDTATIVALITIVGRVIETQERIAVALERVAETMDAVAVYGNVVNVRNTG